METEMQRDRQRKRESYSEAPDVLWDQAQSNMEILAVHCSLNKHLHHKSDNEKKVCVSTQIILKWLVCLDSKLWLYTMVHNKLNDKIRCWETCVWTRKIYTMSNTMKKKKSYKNLEFGRTGTKLNWPNVSKHHLCTEFFLSFVSMLF